MKLRVVWVGKTKGSELRKLCSEYIARIEKFLPLQIKELKEDEQIVGALDVNDRVVALDPEGKFLTSEQLAGFLGKHMSSDPRNLTFVIGGPDGLTEAAQKRADWLWSLSPLTFTHDLTRVILLEQIYRALTIVRNFPYSR